MFFFNAYKNNQLSQDKLIDNSDTINVSYDKLVSIFGEPEEGDEENQDAIWRFNLKEDGASVEIYNWQDGINYLGKKGLPVESIKEWEVSGMDLHGTIIERVKTIIKEGLPYDPNKAEYGSGGIIEVSNTVSESGSGTSITPTKGDRAFAEGGIIENNDNNDDMEIKGYCIATKKKGVKMHGVKIEKTKKGGFMAKGHDGNGNKMCAMISKETAAKFKSK